MLKFPQKLKFFFHITLIHIDNGVAIAEGPRRDWWQWKDVGFGDNYLR